MKHLDVAEALKTAGQYTGKNTDVIDDVLLPAMTRSASVVDALNYTAECVLENFGVRHALMSLSDVMARAGVENAPVHTLSIHAIMHSRREKQLMTHALAV